MWRFLANKKIAYRKKVHLKMNLYKSNTKKSNGKSDKTNEVIEDLPKKRRIEYQGGDRH